MRVVLCDASPLIFLAKIDRLELIRAVLPGEIHVLRCVVDEVCVEEAGSVEMGRLSRFLESVQVIDYENFDHSSQALSQCDRSILNWAIENRPDWLVADERLLRRIAGEEGLAVIGVLGILFQAVRIEILSREEIRKCIDELVGIHDFRISITLYQRVLAEIESL